MLESGKIYAYLLEDLTYSKLTDITTWAKDLMNAHILWSAFVSSFSSMLAAKMGPLSSKNYSLTTLGEMEKRIGGK